MQLKYRPDIDGLRAVAVLAVLFYHTGVPGFSGGFVGVDVFFVISGFLITSTILGDIGAGGFSVARFYERRIRRIFPALYPVIGFSLFAGFWLFDANAYSDLGESVPAIAFFFSNFFYWLESGYFDAPSLQKPLLHTWSLAVEEQFYIFFPLFLVFVSRHLRGRYFVCMLLGLIISFAASAWGVHHKPDHTFYLMPTRAWELLVGSILSLGVIPKPSLLWTKNLQSFFGLGLIIYSICFFSEEVLFPGYNAMVPVLGAALILHGEAREPDVVIINKALSWRPLVLIGLMSYSLYLWHWPIVAFARYMLFRPLSGYEAIGIILVSCMVAFISWKYIEQPFRGKTRLLDAPKRLFGSATLVMLAFSGVGLLVSIQGGMIWRYPSANAVMAQGRWDWYPEGIYGNLEQSSHAVVPGKCGDCSVNPSFLLWGDSHAMSLVPCFDQIARKRGLSGYIATHSSCPPALGASRKDNVFESSDFNQNVIDFIDSTPEIKTVFLAASWSSYINSSSDNYYRPKEVEAGLVSTVRVLRKRGLEVFLVVDTPHLGNYQTPRVFYLAERFPGRYNPKEIVDAPSRAEYSSLNAATNRLFARLQNDYEALVVHQDVAFFDEGGRCKIAVDGRPLYRDDGHLSEFGSRFLASIYDPIFESMACRLGGKGLLVQ